VGSAAVQRLRGPRGRGAAATGGWACLSFSQERRLFIPAPEEACALPVLAHSARAKFSCTRVGGDTAVKCLCGPHGARGPCCSEAIRLAACMTHMF